MDSTSLLDNPFSIQPDTLALKEKARQEGLKTIWDRFVPQ